MPTYAIGDIQGCFSAFEALLTKINFNSHHDTLWCTGDLVNRGPQSLEVLRFCAALDARHQIVLGNHDLHLISLAYETHTLNSKDTLQAILTAPDRDDLIDWLRRRPLLVHDAITGYTMVHAGLAPQWNLQQAINLAQEVEMVLQSDSPAAFLAAMRGNLPDRWEQELTGMERLRCIVNYFTRMRFCYTDGRLDLTYKGTLAHRPAELVPWFSVTPRANADLKIIFGHWSALGGKAEVANVFPLDTGCVWGNCLTAMRLEDGMHFSVSCK